MGKSTAMPANQPVPEVWDSLASSPSENAWAACVVSPLASGDVFLPEYGAWVNCWKSSISRIKYLFWEVNPPEFAFSGKAKQGNKLHEVWWATCDLPEGSHPCWEAEESRTGAQSEADTTAAPPATLGSSAKLSQSLWALIQHSATLGAAGWGQDLLSLPWEWLSHHGPPGCLWPQTFIPGKLLNFLAFSTEKQ